MDLGHEGSGMPRLTVCMVRQESWVASISVRPPIVGGARLQSSGPVWGGSGCFFPLLVLISGCSPQICQVFLFGLFASFLQIWISFGTSRPSVASSWVVGLLVIQCP